jgi:hypothetical protein
MNAIDITAAVNEHRGAIDEFVESFGDLYSPSTVLAAMIVVAKSKGMPVKYRVAPDDSMKFTEIYQVDFNGFLTFDSACDPAFQLGTEYVQVRMTSIEAWEYILNR